MHQSTLQRQTHFQCVSCRKYNDKPQRDTVGLRYGNERLRKDTHPRARRTFSAPSYFDCWLGISSGPYLRESLQAASSVPSKGPNEILTPARPFAFGRKLRPTLPVEVTRPRLLLKLRIRARDRVSQSRSRQFLRRMQVVEARDGAHQVLVLGWYPGLL